MTESMRERMERALEMKHRKKNGDPQAWIGERPNTPLTHRETVDAILDVLAEPTMDMGLAGAGPINEHMRGDVKADYFAAIDSFKAMITAIRKGA